MRLWVTVGVVALAACGGGPPTPPAGADFHTPPEPLPEGEPGHVIWAESIPAPDGVEAWNVLYLSEAIDGDPIAVSGWVAIPQGGDAVPVVAFAHGTVGLGDECAPTRRGGQAPHNFQAALDRGWAVAYTDYQGLGTPGLHHYLVGSVEAQAMYDVVRAAGDLDGRVTPATVFWGFSQGGHAALFAGELASARAPDLDVAGVVAVAPAVDVSGWLAANPPGERQFLVLMALAYVDALGLERAAVLSPQLNDRAERIEHGCLMDAATAASGTDSLFSSEGVPAEVQAFALANDPGVNRIDVPVLLASSEADPLLRPDLADEFAAVVCAAGTTLDRIVASDATHLQVMSATNDFAVEWMADRFAGVPTAGVCGQP